MARYISASPGRPRKRRGPPQLGRTGPDGVPDATVIQKEYNRSMSSQLSNRPRLYLSKGRKNRERPTYRDLSR